jgi:polyisoprenoid-binding protein YceI
MRQSTKWSLAALVILIPGMVAWTETNNMMALQPQSRLWIEGTSTVQDFTCTAKGFDVRVQSATAGASSAVLSGTKAVTTGEVRVPARRMDCDNGTMNDHMYRALKVDEHPEIIFRLTAYELASKAGAKEVSVWGDLTLGGKRQAIYFKANATEGAGGALRLVGSHEVRMTEFDLRPPTLMLGTMRVNERVKVNFDLMLRG